MHAPPKPPDETRLRIVTAGLDHAPACSGTMTCPCQPCAHERLGRTPEAPKPQPWDPRPARTRLAA